MLTLAGMALAASEANMVTGVVQKVDQRSGRIVIDCQTFLMKRRVARWPSCLRSAKRSPSSSMSGRPKGDHEARASRRLSTRTADLEASP
jgi:hypothetical protein